MSEPGDRIAQRFPTWNTLKRLAAFVKGMPDAEVLLAQMQQIEEHRQLLDQPDPVPPLLANLTQLFRDTLNGLDKAYDAQHQAGMARLAADDNWRQLTPEQRNDLLSQIRLAAADKPVIQLGSTEEILATLDRVRPDAFGDRIAALSRFDQVLQGAAELMEPRAKFVSLPRRALKSREDIDAWMHEVRGALQRALQDGPVIVG